MMKKIVSRIVLTAFLMCMLMFTFKTQSIKAGPGEEIWVPYNYPTIQEAIDAANPGDSIHVTGGPYYEHVVVNESVSLIGEGEVVIDGSSTGTVVNIQANGVTVSGFTIQNSGPDWGQLDSGVKLIGRSNCSVVNNHINSSRLGIYVQSSSNIRMISNNVTYNIEGVRLDGSSNNNIDYNNITHNDSNLVLSSSSSNNVKANRIANGTLTGLHLQYFSSNNTLYNNRVTNNTNGIGLSQSSNNTIFHNSFVNNTNQVWLHLSYDNVWDVEWPTGGNYWGDHIRNDEFSGQYQNQPGSDGICDTPYNVYNGNIDKYPLMGPSNVFDVWFAMLGHQISIISNSSISDFQMNTTQRIISFNVTDDGIGFCRVDIPDVIVDGMWQANYTVLVNGEPVEFRNWTEGAQTYIYFRYHHSEHEVIIIPEFPIWQSLLFITTVLTVAIVIYKRKLFKTQIHY